MSLSLQLDFVFLPVSLKFFLDFLQPLAQKERHKFIHKLYMFHFLKFYHDTLQRVDKITSFAFSLLAFKYSNSVLNCFTSVA